MTVEWKFRNGTLDQAIFNGVVLFNEYQLPDHFEPHDIVIDIGAHIGSFAHAVLSRGCANVYAIEPDRRNFEIASEHLRAHIENGHLQLINSAAWRSDDNNDQLYFDGYHPFPRSYVGMAGVLNTGNGSVIWSTGKPVAKVAFDDIVDLVTHRGEKRVRLLKLDCEGSEWPILLTSRRLNLIDEICGEFHELGGSFLEISEDRAGKLILSEDTNRKYTIDTLVSHLNGAGFEVTYTRHRRPTGELEGLGLFFARRTL
jgi:FkbM family methyltransferase